MMKYKGYTGVVQFDDKAMIFHLRLKRDLHAKLATEAKLQGMSLNNYINSTLQRAVG